MEDRGGLTISEEMIAKSSRLFPKSESEIILNFRRSSLDQFTTQDRGSSAPSGGASGSPGTAPWRPRALASLQRIVAIGALPGFVDRSTTMSYSPGWLPARYQSAGACDRAVVPIVTASPMTDAVLTIHGVLADNVITSFPFLLTTKVHILKINFLSHFSRSSS